MYVENKITDAYVLCRYITKNDCQSLVPIMFEAAI